MSGTTAAGAAFAAAVAIAVLFGCTAGSAAEGTWGEDSAGNPQLELAGNGTPTGTDGCNRLSGTWSEDKQTVTFGEFAATQMYCEDVDTWLSTMSTAIVDDATMTVFDSSGAEIGTLAKAG